jgi:hypothetical protein
MSLPLVNLLVNDILAWVYGNAVGLWIIAAWRYDVMATLPIATNPFPIVLAGVATHCSAYLYMCGPLCVRLCI